MSEQVLSHLRDRGIAQLQVMNRSREKAEELAKQFGGKVVGWGEWDSALQTPDVVVGSVSAEEPVLRRDIVERAMAARGNRALFLMDLGVPRNIDAKVAELYNVYVYNTDDLTEIVQQNRNARESEIPHAQGIVEEHVSKFLSWQASVELVGLVDALRTKLREERATFIRSRMEPMKHLSETDRAQVEKLMDEMLEKVLLEPAQRLRGEKELRRKIQNVEALRDLFSFESGEAVRILRIGTRGSMLAKWQAQSIRKQLFAATGMEAEIVIIKTSGDKMQQAPLSQIGGKGIFIKELEEALLEESIDLAVHSVKDIPTDIHSRLMFPAVCKRDDVRDCLVGSTLANLRQGARVGTSSLRRQAQLKHLRPDLDLRDLRGNVDTRLRKVESGEYEAIMVSKAGLDRLGLSKRIAEVLSPDVCMPAVGQGAIAVQCRLKDTEAGDLLAPLDDAETRTAIIAERALLAALQGGCQVPLGAWARVERGELWMEACVCSVDGLQYVKQRATAPPDQATQLGEHLARLLIEAGAQSILEEVSRQRG